MKVVVCTHLFIRHLEKRIKRENKHISALVEIQEGRAMKELIQFTESIVLNRIKSLI